MFKVGDKIRIRKDANLSDTLYTKSMAEYKGAIGIITDIRVGGKYRVEHEDGQSWTWRGHDVTSFIEPTPAPSIEGAIIEPTPGVLIYYPIGGHPPFQIFPTKVQNETI